MAKKDQLTAGLKQQAEPDLQTWLTDVSGYERAFQSWRSRVEKIVKIYRDHDHLDNATRDASTVFNILWSNVQVLKPAVFARLPKPDVSRRFRDNDPVGRVAALILERALDFEIDHYSDYRAAMDADVLDWLLGGRGTAWVRYEPHIAAMGPGDDGYQITEDVEAGEEGEQAPQEYIENECAPVDYVHWRDFGHKVARTWEEIPRIWRKCFMGRTALIERFGEEKGNEIPLDTKPNDPEKDNGGQDAEHQACVFEGWDKERREVVWFAKGMPNFLDRKPDPLGLEGFWPCPRPLLATVTTDSLVPVPDYKLYQDQARELNTLADRIDGLIDMLKVRGVHDKAVPELARLFKEAGNGTLIGVNDFAKFAEKNGLRGSIELFDLAPIVSALNEATAAVTSVKTQIYEIMGIADIVRGSTDPNETLGAQKMKGQFGNMRLRSRQSAVIQFATELLQIKAQIMCKHFQPETLLRIAAADQLMPQDRQYVMPALQLLIGERAMNPEADTERGPLAGFRIEVSSDSMIQMDEAQEKADRTEFIEKIGNYFKNVMPMVQGNPQMAVVAAGLLKFVVAGFKVGKTVEGMIDGVLDQLQQQAQQPQQPKPDPEMAKVQATASAKQQELAMKGHLDQMQLAGEERLEQVRQAMQAQQVAQQNQIEAAREQQRQENEARLQQMQAVMDRQSEQNAAQLAVILQHLKNQGSVEVAEVSKETTLQAAQISAAAAGAGGNE